MKLLRILKKVIVWAWKILASFAEGLFTVLLGPKTITGIVRSEIKAEELKRDEKFIDESDVEYITGLNIRDLFKLRDALQVLVNLNFGKAEPFLKTVQFVLNTRYKRKHAGLN